MVQPASLQSTSRSQTVRLVRWLLAFAIGIGSILALLSTPPPALAQQFGTEDDCVHADANCIPSGHVTLSGNWGAGCQWHETLDWGDGTVINRVIDGGSHPISHQYTSPGLYMISSTGFGVPDDPDERICTFVPTMYLIEVPAAGTVDDDDDDDQDSHRIVYIERNADRTDRPVREGRVSRTWMWGHWFLPRLIAEPYNDSPGGEREVTYFDKSRMEINDPDGDPEDLWYVTNGLLVVEMVEGKFQVGDNEFDHSPEPADVPIGGDPVNPDAPTYANINEWGLQEAPALDEGTLITHTIRNGEVVNDDHYGQYGVTAAHRVQVDHINHTVASVFWDFMNSEGEVYQDGAYVTDNLFVNPFYATGLPITEAYWGNILVAGEPTDVLWQCFERRCLTYNPANDEGWQVEAANVGQHYYYWRYGERPWE